MQKGKRIRKASLPQLDGIELHGKTSENHGALAAGWLGNESRVEGGWHIPAPHPEPEQDFCIPPLLRPFCALLGKAAP